MKYKLFLFITCIACFANAQPKPFYKQTITAYEFNKKDTINKKVMVTLLDSLRKIITTENNIQNAISGAKGNPQKSHAVIEVDNDRLYISADIDEKGDTISKLIYVYDEKKNRIANYQIKNRDTINGQKRVYDESGKDIRLYNKQKDSHKYFLRMEWEYDANGDMTGAKTYNEAGQLVGLDEYENKRRNDELTVIKSSHVNGKGMVKQNKDVKKGNVTTSYFYANTTGYNYGIKIIHMDGGMSIKAVDGDGCFKELQLFDDRKNLIAHVTSVESKL